VAVSLRLSIITYNIWNTERWPEREPSLRAFVRTFKPDVLCLQELRPETRDSLDDAMPAYDRVRDDFPGWLKESTIYWRADSLEEVEHGAEDVGLIEPDRRLFWVRLQADQRSGTLLVATVHLTYQGHPAETESGRSPRVLQTRRIISALRGLAREDEPVILTGDLNDPYLPMRMLLAAGYPNCFAGLGIPTEPTHPSYPTAGVAPRHAAQTIDWIVSNQHARAVAAQVPHFYHGDLAPSDHWPVLAVYEI
jgi:endonuclease/exonuclease/phosphatase family metal-dependent hydrolase